MTSQRTPSKKVRVLSAPVLLLAALTLLTVFAGAAIAQTIDPTTRTVTTTNFSVTWNTGTDTEAITTINWMGGQNLTNNQGIDTCWPDAPGSVEYFGNSYAPPDPWAGGLVLVGGGTTTPAGTTAWLGQILSSGTAQVTINSSSTGCPPSSAGINVQTTYSFQDPEDSSTNSFGVQRAFNFSTTTFAHDFRPYMARLSLYEGFTEVLYPDTSGALATLNVYDCALGCTGPIVIPDATLLSPLWDATQGWFAIHNPTTLQGVVVARSPSTDPQGNPIVAQLWVDNDEDSDTGTNVSSFLLMSPTAGFTGGTVTEVETLCFYNSSIWTPSLTPPAACSQGPTSATSTTLTSSLNSSIYGQAVIFTASVTSSSGTPTGSVVFTDTSTGTTLGSATLSSGTASISVSSLAAGSHSITAAYQGSATFSGSTSTPLSQTVTAASTTTALASSQNPAGTNQTVSFTATIASQYGSVATGTATFYSGSQTLGTASLLSNRATLGASFTTAGTYSISAKYNGDANNLGSTSPVLSEVINPAITSTTTTLTSSPNPSLVGQSVAFTAAVTSAAGSPPNGEMVTFYNGSSVLGTATLSAGIATLITSSLPLGTFTITATYPGDANFSASTSPGLRQVVNAATKYATSTTLASSSNPSIKGQPITFTAAVTSTGGTPPNGESVTFYNGLNVLGTATLTGGVASLAKSSLGSGIHSISAAYLGDANFTASTSPVLEQAVDTTSQSPTTTALASSLNPSIYGQSVTWTATVTTSGKTTPTGKVNFNWGSDSIGSATLNSSGVATLTKSNLSADPYPLFAVYTGDTNNGPSASPILNQTVTQATSAATLTSSPNPSAQGQSVTFTATITSPTTTPTGPVTFSAGKTTLGTVELSKGKATLTVSSLAVGTTTVTVTYPWNSDISNSSAEVTQTVQQ
jgi:Big-like domain-containing protein